MTTRLAQYLFSIYLNKLLIDKEKLYANDQAAAIAADYTNIVKTYRKIGQCMTYCDYSKIALGFVQLASMCRLAIEIRYSVENLVQSAETYEEDDSETIRFKSMAAMKNYKLKKRLSVICCSIGAIVSMIVAVWLTVVLFNIDD